MLVLLWSSLLFLPLPVPAELSLLILLFITFFNRQTLFLSLFSPLFTLPFNTISFRELWFECCIRICSKNLWFFLLDWKKKKKKRRDFGCIYIVLDVIGVIRNRKRYTYVWKQICRTKMSCLLPQFKCLPDTFALTFKSHHHSATQLCKSLQPCSLFLLVVFYYDIYIFFWIFCLGFACSFIFCWGGVIISIEFCTENLKFLFSVVVCGMCAISGYFVTWIWGHVKLANFLFTPDSRQIETLEDNLTFSHYIVCGIKNSGSMALQ